MKKILSAIIVSIFLISGMSSFATSEADDSKQFVETITFSQPFLSNNNEKTMVSVDSITTNIIEPGKPVLPSLDKTYTFPSGTKIKDITCKVYGSDFQSIDYEIEYAPMPTINGKQIESDTEKITSDFTVFPQKWFDYNTGSGLDGLERKLFVKLSVFPVKYHQQSQELEYIEKVDININYELPEISPSPKDEIYTFLILTPTDFTTELEPLVTHKINTQNLSTKVVTTHEIYSGTYFETEGRDNPEKIKYFIKNAIEQWDTKYVMFVGGSEFFPTRDVHVYVNYNEGDDEIFISDLYYADIYDSNDEFSSWDTNDNDVFGEYDWNNNNDEVDLYPDVHFGRLAVTNRGMLTDVINKIITYEENEAWTQDWFNKVVVIGGDTVPKDDSGVDEGEFVNQAVLGYLDGFIPDKIWDSNGRLSGVTPTGVANIKDGINNGCGFLDWAGHGASWVWTTYPHDGSRQNLPTPTGMFTNSQISELNNGDKLPIVVTGACSVGKFNIDFDCFTWSFVSNPDGGGIGAYGANSLSWGYSSDYVIEDLGGKLHVGYYKAYDNGAYTFGELHTESLNNYITFSLDGGDHKTIEQWTPFGDPSLMVRDESLPPAKPTLEGPSSGKIREEHTFTATSTDPEGDDISFLFDWGDGTLSEWIGPVDSGDVIETTNIWEEQGDYQVRVRVKDERGVQSEWSDPLPITMPKQKMFSWMQLFEDILQKIFLFTNWV